MTLMIRIANERHNAISGARAKLWLFREERTPEGQQFRRYYDLPLLRPEHPFFALSWTLLHVIDKNSPLFGLSPENLATNNSALALTVSGLDDNSAQQLHARRVYSPHDIRWQHSYVDITHNAADGRLVLDYDKFHDVTPDDA
jgi:inward rectifier potassium channel